MPPTRRRTIDELSGDITLPEDPNEVPDYKTLYEDLLTQRATAAAYTDVAVPEHGAGPGMTVAETWCQADQTAAFAATQNSRK